MSVWSDDRIVTLAKQFVAATDEVWRLQRGKDPECRTFQEMASGGHYPGGGSKQGIYIVAGSGKLLGSINAFQPDRVLEVMTRGLKRWQAMPAAERSAMDETAVRVDHRWEHSIPKDGLVLLAFNRDLPPPLPSATPRSARYNRDHVWFSRSEARRLLPPQPLKGHEHPWPADLLNRFVALHLCDNVHGQAIPFAVEEIVGSRITTRVLSNNGEMVEIEIQGETHADADGEWRGGDNDWKPSRPYVRSIHHRVVGRAVYDLSELRFTSFEVVTLARWRGKPGVNRRPENGTGLLGFYFQIAPENEPPIPPAYIDIYNVPWVKKRQTP